MAFCHCQLYVLSDLCQEYADEFIGMLDGYSGRHLILCSLLLISRFRSQCCWGLLNSSRFCNKTLCSLRTPTVVTLLSVTHFILFTIPWMDEKIICFPATMMAPDSSLPCLIYYTSIIRQSGGHKSTERYFSLILSWEELLQTFGLQGQGKIFVFSVNLHTLKYNFLLSLWAVFHCKC